LFYHWREHLLPKRVSALKPSTNAAAPEMKAPSETLVDLLRSYLETRKPISGGLVTIPRNPSKRATALHAAPDPGVNLPEVKDSNPLSLIAKKRQTTATSSTAPPTSGAVPK